MIGITKPTTQILHHSSTPFRDIYSPGRLLITSGSQQLLYMTTEALCDEGDIVLVEDPTYFVYSGHPPKPRSARARRAARTRRPRPRASGKRSAIAQTQRRIAPRQNDLPRQLLSKSHRRHDQLREEMRHPETAEKIRARRRTPDLPARRRGLSRIAFCRHGDVPVGARRVRTARRTV